MDFSGLFKRVGQWKANPIFTKYKGNSRRCLLRGRWGRAAGGHKGTVRPHPRRARCGWSGEIRPLGGISGIVHLWLQERDAPAASPPVIPASLSVIPASPNKTPQATLQPSGLPLSPRKRNGFRGLFLFCSRRDVWDIIRPPTRAPAAGRQQSPAQPGGEIRSPSALPQGWGGGTRGRRSGGHRPPSRGGGRTAALLDKGHAVELSRPPTSPEGSRRRPGKPLTASPPGKGPSQPPGDTAGTRRGGWSRVRDGEHCGGTLVEIALKYSTELQV